MAMSSSAVGGALSSSSSFRWVEGDGDGAGTLVELGKLTWSGRVIISELESALVCRAATQKLCCSKRLVPSPDWRAESFCWRLASLRSPSKPSERSMKSSRKRPFLSIAFMWSVLYGGGASGTAAMIAETFVVPTRRRPTSTLTLPLPSTLAEAAALVEALSDDGDVAAVEDDDEQQPEGAVEGVREGEGEER